MNTNIDAKNGINIENIVVNTSNNKIKNSTYIIINSNLNNDSCNKTM